ncbi:hypothetical protein EPK99_06835 [Neorhizobium lilium]|uniref:Uncharacterized protein n=1 Tax=Neorhizobium lilium TaxID=2503024 RepID=A0A444LH22_9HYPH|nr:hypothetical protein [Neorhizobium lilium]RWX78331.1 hypothetical protein EPK99_06835 [Neorhizobium lilium]
MSEYRFSFPACVIAGKGRIETCDVIMLRKHAFPDGVRSRDDVAAMLALHNLCPDQCDAWKTFFVEALAAYAVFQERPSGRIDDEKASWLMRTFSPDGTISTGLELEMLLHAIELASETSDNLSVFVLDQIRMSLSPNPGCAHAIARLPAAAVTAYDLDLIWRLLRSAVDRGRLALSLREAAVLKEIDLLTEGSQNHPPWNEMMTQIVTFDQRPGATLRALADAMSAASEGQAA